MDVFLRASVSSPGKWGCVQSPWGSLLGIQHTEPLGMGLVLPGPRSPLQAENSEGEARSIDPRPVILSLGCKSEPPRRLYDPRSPGCTPDKDVSLWGWGLGSKMVSCSQVISIWRHNCDPMDYRGSHAHHASGSLGGSLNAGCWVQPQNLWLNWSVLEPRNLYFEQVPRWSWCCWSWNPTLGTSGL